MIKKIFIIIVLLATTAQAGFVPIGAQQFNDSLFRIFDNADPMKKLAFEISGITTYENVIYAGENVFYAGEQVVYGLGFGEIVLSVSHDCEIDQDLSTTADVVHNSLVTGGDIGVAGDTDLLQLDANTLTVNGDVAITGDITTSPTIADHPHQDVRTTASVLFAQVSTPLIVSNKVFIGPGTEALPTLTFINPQDGNTGIWRSAADTLNISTAGVERFEIDANETTFTVPIATTALAVDTNTLVVDAENHRVGIGTTDPNSKLKVAGAISSATMTITASADNTDVSGINTIFINPASANVIIGGFTGGVEGQVLYIAIKGIDFTTTLENVEGVGDQDIYLCDESDDTLDDYGGWVLICDGSNWYDCGHAKHVQ